MLPAARDRARTPRCGSCVEAGWGGARVELDGQIDAVVEPQDPVQVTARLRPGDATLVALGDEEPLLAGLRRRKILMDSPRMLARDDRNPVEQERV